MAEKTIWNLGVCCHKTKQREFLRGKKGMNRPKGYFWNKGNVLKLYCGDDCMIL